MIIRDLPLLHSNFRASESLHDYLVRNKTVAIADIDTRRLTTLLREKGSQGGAILTGVDATVEKAQELIAAIRQHGRQRLGKRSFLHRNLRMDRRRMGSWAKVLLRPSEQPYHVVAYDFRRQNQHPAHARLSRLPPDRRSGANQREDVLALNPDGVFLSNGPGDPEPCDYAIKAVQKLMESGKPIFGICLGHQLISLAIGAKTLKMRFSHHGANHPVQDLDSGKVVITSQNHGFAVDADTLPTNARITHKSLFDNTLQGIELTDKPVFCFQGHPEASPGPQDVGYLFDKFIDNIKAAKQ